MGSYILPGRTVDPVLLMESLFRLTELEVRVPLNMNVLSGGQIPNVLSLRDVLRQCKFIKPLLMREPPDPTSFRPRGLNFGPQQAQNTDRALEGWASPEQISQWRANGIVE